MSVFSIFTLLAGYQVIVKPWAVCENASSIAGLGDHGVYVSRWSPSEVVLINQDGKSSTVKAPAKDASFEVLNGRLIATSRYRLADLRGTWIAYGGDEASKISEYGDWAIVESNGSLIASYGGRTPIYIEQKLDPIWCYNEAKEMLITAFDNKGGLPELSVYSKGKMDMKSSRISLPKPGRSTIRYLAAAGDKVYYTEILQEEKKTAVWCLKAGSRKFILVGTINDWIRAHRPRATPGSVVVDREGRLILLIGSNLYRIQG